MSNFIEPYYLVDFNSSICNFEILINDMPAFLHEDGGSIASHYPINHLICQSGEQAISIKIYPLNKEIFLREDGFVKIKVHYYDATKSPDELIELYNYETPDLSKIKLPIIEQKAIFRATVPYNLQGWYKSLKLTDIKLIEEDAKAFYKNLYLLLKNGNNKQFIQLLKTKFTEVDAAMYLSNVNNEKDWTDILKQIQQAEMLLLDFPEVTRSVFYGNGKVINLTRGDGTPIIFYQNKKQEEFGFPILLHKLHKNSEFEIIR